MMNIQPHLNYPTWSSAEPETESQRDSPSGHKNNFELEGNCKI
jgi:hypothetical protein